MCSHSRFSLWARNKLYASMWMQMFLAMQASIHNACTFFSCPLLPSFTSFKQVSLLFIGLTTQTFIGNTIALGSLSYVCQVFTSAFVYLSRGCFWPDSSSLWFFLKVWSTFLHLSSSLCLRCRCGFGGRRSDSVLGRLQTGSVRPPAVRLWTAAQQIQTHPAEVHLKITLIPPVGTAAPESCAPCPNQTWREKATFIGAYNCILNIRCLLIGCDCVMSHFHLQFWTLQDTCLVRTQ